ncbi:MAG TPA: sugar phosphate isomerase/epimerase [Candidatus Limnocylindria bacterium]|nr:sugar phosphate isomerase/epimerase [Candidatus Limnocylindria bacterium]
MMRLAGHTMGTPEYTLHGAMDLFAGMGLEGIEVIVQTDGYPCAIALDAGKRDVAAMRAAAADRGLEIAALTPYLNLFNATDEAVRQRECDALKRVTDMAAEAGAKNIRVYGGKFVDGEDDAQGLKLDALVRSMRECGDHAGACGVRLNMENHFGTMTTTARATAAVAARIAHPAVGILYDQANIAFFPAEEYPEAIRLQKDWIHYVHCKDLVYRGGTPQKPRFSHVSHVDEDERTVHSRIPGEGILDWPGILRALHAAGYGGWVSLEYERRWQKVDLPDASVGMRRAAEHIRGILEEIYG